jgi:hypothetical protein
MRTILLGLAERALKPPAAVPALTMRANSEGEKYNDPAALLCKMLLILKALLHPDTHAPMSAFLTHKQGSVDVRGGRRCRWGGGSRPRLDWIACGQGQQLGFARS